MSDSNSFVSYGFPEVEAHYQKSRHHLNAGLPRAFCINHGLYSAQTYSQQMSTGGTCLVLLATLTDRRERFIILAADSALENTRKGTRQLNVVEAPVSRDEYGKVFVFS